MSEPTGSGYAPPLGAVPYPMCGHRDPMWDSQCTLPSHEVHADGMHRDDVNAVVWATTPNWASTNPDGIQRGMWIPEDRGQEHHPFVAWTPVDLPICDEVDG